MEQNTIIRLLNSRLSGKKGREGGYRKFEASLQYKVMKAGKMYKDKEHPKGISFSLTPLYNWGFLESEKGGNLFGGLGMSLGDIWATEVLATGYQLKGNSYELAYKVILMDHFCLDKDDLKWIFSLNRVLGKGFLAWFLLQHFHGYKPFITKITFTKEFKGSLWG